jgi:hypothetical protein
MIYLTETMTRGGPMGFWIMMGGISMLLLGTMAASSHAEGTVERNWYTALAVIGLLVAFGAIATGLWEAWSPWELTSR